ncbi:MULTISPECIES: hypothetical protein [Streptomyces]|uniref:Right handed beta helix domain-containing protein n=1 Tax=Streptomyces canarius TaxID=285453 RepID=A0ABQ3CWM7_9ACTN|nr:hypothetical protein [Streptomyces canarius]GHA46261.1 hypothetical protein GCM10010345_58480 [Streptomyces canarius]
MTCPCLTADREALSVGPRSADNGNQSTVEVSYLLDGTDGGCLYGNGYDHTVVNNYFDGLSGRALIDSGTTRFHHPRPLWRND